MPDNPMEITPWHWAGFIAVVLVFLSLDLGVFHRKARIVQFKEALTWTCIWVSFSLGFAGALVPTRGSEEAQEFLTGYVLELSLSMDNVFVIALIFSYFRVKPIYQHRVLFWGILGALVMRGVMIILGVELIHRFEFLFYFLGLVVLVSGVRMLTADEDGVDPEKNPVVLLTRRFFPITKKFHQDKFVVNFKGKKILTPLALVLIVVETTDLVFAIDSIPAIFSITTKPFIIFTSNVFAILGLRSLYFVLAGAMAYFRLLKYGLSIVLVFIGVKMLLFEYYPIPIGYSLLTVVGVISVSVFASVFMAKTHRAG